MQEIETTRLARLEQQPEEGKHAMVRLLARVIGIGIETADARTAQLDNDRGACP
jgi:transposase